MATAHTAEPLAGLQTESVPDSAVDGPGMEAASFAAVSPEMTVDPIAVAELGCFEDFASALHCRPWPASLQH